MTIKTLKQVYNKIKNKYTFYADNKRISEEKFDYLEILAQRTDCIYTESTEDKIYLYKTIYY